MTAELVEVKSPIWPYNVSTLIETGHDDNLETLPGGLPQHYRLL